jgi:Ku70/Ku80-like protein
VERTSPRRDFITRSQPVWLERHCAMQNASSRPDVRLRAAATSTEVTIAFRMIHEPSGKPIRYLKGIETDKSFKEVPEEEIIKGYEHSKGHHVLIKLEGKEPASQKPARAARGKTATSLRRTVH